MTRAGISVNAGSELPLHQRLAGGIPSVPNFRTVYDGRPSIEVFDMCVYDSNKSTE